MDFPDARFYTYIYDVSWHYGHHLHPSTHLALLHCRSTASHHLLSYIYLHRSKAITETGTAMEETTSFLCGGCCAVVCTQIQYLICGTRQYGADSTCCDNCCRCNCGWKNDAPLPVEDYPIANSEAQDRTQTVDGMGAKGEDAPAPAYEATPQMSTGMPQSDASAAPTPTAPTASAPAAAATTDVKTQG
ncbi:hypothetical protein PHBOTO_004644 [Pseudozyma hubeiensis]|nr:hypothetical protein PHBOTO_004644 [Pseudozyma hubeiensis]